MAELVEQDRHLEVANDRAQDPERDETSPPVELPGATTTMIWMSASPPTTLIRLAPPVARSHEGGRSLASLSAAIAPSAENDAKVTVKFRESRNRPKPMSPGGSDGLGGGALGVTVAPPQPIVATATTARKRSGVILPMMRSRNLLTPRARLSLRLTLDGTPGRGHHSWAGRGGDRADHLDRVNSRHLVADRRRVTDDEFRLIYPTIQNAALAQRLGVTVPAVVARARRLGVRKDPKFISDLSSRKSKGLRRSPETRARIGAAKRAKAHPSDEELMRLYPSNTNADLARRFGVSASTVSTWGRNLGLRKSPEHWTRMQRERSKGRPVSAETRAKPRSKALGREVLPETMQKALRTKIERGTLLRGQDHPKWKGGRPWKRFKDPAYQAWRNAVLSRDDFTCRDCGRRCPSVRRAWLHITFSPTGIIPSSATTWRMAYPLSRLPHGSARKGAKGHRSCALRLRLRSSHPS